MYDYTSRTAETAVRCMSWEIGTSDPIAYRIVLLIWPLSIVAVESSRIPPKSNMRSHESGDMVEDQRV